MTNRKNNRGDYKKGGYRKNNNKKGNYEGKNYNDYRFEFSFSINTHIICKRRFNLYNYNEEVLASSEMKKLMDKITGDNIDGFGTMGIIPSFFKELGREELWEDYNPYWAQSKSDIFKYDIHSKKDVFTFRIKVDNRVVAESSFDGAYFQPSVRFEINIREIIPDIIREIKSSFTKLEYDDVYDMPTDYEGMLSEYEELQKLGEFYE